MAGRPDAPRRLTADQLARAAPVERADIDRLVELGMLAPDPDGYFRPSDIQRVRAVMAMRSPGIELEQLVGAFRGGYFTLQPMDMLYPEPAVAADLTFSQLAAELGLEVDQFLRVVIAAGFPAPPPDSPVREDDAELARLLVEAGTKLGGGEILQRTARIFGEAARRTAEASIALFDEGVNQPLVSRHGNVSQIDPALRSEMNALGAQLMHLSEQLLARLFRRHLEHAMLELWAHSAEQALDQLGIRPLEASSPGLAFVDLANFSRLTGSAGDSAAARMAARLAELAELATARHRGRVVKLLGDGAMLYFRDPGDAARGALELVAVIDASDLPPARGGVHAGPVIERDGDYFGQAVNTAARIAAVAEPGQVVASRAVADRAARGLAFTPLGERELKGIGRLDLFAASVSAG